MMNHRISFLMTPADQLPLFEPPPEVNEHAAALQQQYADARRIAAALPDGLYFGTSSWSFRGWAGIVYSRARSTTELAREGLREYAQHPLLTTVGIDRSYYAPIPLADLVAYADQLPSQFKCCIKAPVSVTGVTIGPSSGRPEPNPDFLSIDRLADDLLEPLAAGFAAHAGPIILEFPPFARGARLEPGEFLDSLDAFLEALPREFTYAVELRDKRLLTSRYTDILRAHGIGHTYNYWSAMPTPGEQTRVVAPEDLPFTIVRLLLKPGTWYEDQRQAFQPFDRLVAPDTVMRGDVVAVANRALVRKKRVFLLVNNKAEGSSPLTILELARRFAAAPEDTR